MDGKDVGRRVGWSRTEAKARAKLALLWRRRRGTDDGVTAVECLKNAKEPQWRFEGLRRRLGASA